MKPPRLLIRPAIRLIQCGLALGILACTPSVRAADASATARAIGGRRILHESGSDPELRLRAARLLDGTAPRIDDVAMPLRTHHFLRLTERRYLLDSRDHLLPAARLGGAPIVFLTVPEAAVGRTLYGLYSDLGYGADDVLRQRGVPMVAVLFRYPDRVRIPDPWEAPTGPGWESRVYHPTWETVFELFANLAGESRAGTFTHFPSLTTDERRLARFLPEARRRTVAALPYPLLRLSGGTDWEYRLLLERCLSLNSHFSGMGVTENTLSPGDGRKGLPEFVGPDLPLSELAAMAVVDLGQLEFDEIHPSGH